MKKTAMAPALCAHMLARLTMARRYIFAAICVALSAFALTADAQTAPPAPVLPQPGAGAAFVQPITLAWGAVVDPDGPIGSYTWQVSPTSTFAFIIAAGFTNTPADGSPARTQATVSGLPNGAYFWRVKATQIVGGAVFAMDSAASVPPPPTPLSPIGGATVTLPFTLDWTDTANPQVAGYDVDIDNEPNFLGTVGVLFVGGVTRSDYMVVPDPLVDGFNHFPPGTYFWRVRADHGDVVGSWSAGQSFTVAPLPATPPGLAIFHIIT